MTATAKRGRPSDPRHWRDADLRRHMSRYRHRLKSLSFAPSTPLLTQQVEAELERRRINTLDRARTEVSRLHPDHGGPGGAEFQVAKRRLDELKRHV